MDDRADFDADIKALLEAAPLTFKVDEDKYSHADVYEMARVLVFSLRAYKANILDAQYAFEAAEVGVRKKAADRGQCMWVYLRKLLQTLTRSRSHSFVQLVVGMFAAAEY